MVLSISRPEQFEKYIGKPPRYSDANLVHAVPPAEAPSELASYLGYDTIVVPDGAILDSLDEAQRRALEAYVATGGYLLVGGSVRSPAMFPLLKAIRPGTSNYGFGKLFVTTGAPSSELQVFRSSLPVSPHGGRSEYERRYNSDVTKELLLPQATAPLGRFLLIITLFTLAIGPGSVWVARRRGPAALLVTIPGTAIVTCAMIIGYSIVADGFTVHTSSYGYTLLEPTAPRHHPGRHRLHANLGLEGQLRSLTALVAPFEDHGGVRSQPGVEGRLTPAATVPSTYRE